MTRIFTDGAEFRDVLFWTITYVTDTVTTTYRSGEASYRITTGGGYCYKDITALSELYIRFGWYMDTFNTGHRLPAFYNLSTAMDYLSLDAQSHLCAYRGDGTLLEDSGILMTTDIWHLIEIYLKIGDADGRFVVRWDGAQVINYTGDTKVSTYTDINRIQFSSNNSFVLLDDLALNDTNGATDNSWCGDGHIIKLTPSGSSATANDWLNSGSVSGSANYTYVDDFPANTTDYVYASASSTGLQTQFALTNPSLPAGAGVSRIYTEARARKFSGNEYGLKLGQLASGGTDVVSGSRTLSMGSFTQVLGDEVTINPVTGLPWTETDLNNLEVVLEI